MGRALTAVAIALVVCFAVLGTVVYVTRDEDGVAVDAILSEQLTRAVNESERDQEPVDLAYLTPFLWDRVVVFDARTPRDDVSRELGFDWHGELEYTAQSTDLFVFVRDGKLVRFADYRGVGRFEGLERPFASLTPDQAVFEVRDLVARPVT
jgi:hypothetical protein